MDDVEAASAKREREVGANAHRDSDVRPARDRDRRPDRDHVLVDTAVQGSTSGEEVARSRGRCEHGHSVAEFSKRIRHAVDVSIHLVRLRPRKWRDEADAEAHRRLTIAHLGNGTTLYLPRMAEVTIKARANGPYKVEGPVRIVDADGQRVRSPGGKRDRPLSLRALADQAVLRQVPQAYWVRRRGSVAARPRLAQPIRRRTSRSPRSGVSTRVPSTAPREATSSTPSSAPSTRIALGWAPSEVKRWSTGDRK